MADKPKARGLLDLLGVGAARKAGDALANRQKQLDDAIDGPKLKKKGSK